MIEKFKKMASLAYDVMLDIQDGLEPNVDPQLQMEKKLCGLWIALRQKGINLTAEEIEVRTRIDTSMLILLETGLASTKLDRQDIVQDEQWHSLALVLENGTHDFKHVMDVINIALGVPVPSRKQVLEKVYGDLAAPIQRLEALEAESIETSIGVSAAIEFALRQEVEQTLIALANGATTALEIKKEIVKRTRGRIEIGSPTIHRVLQVLQKDDFIRAYRKPDSKENRYALTEDGLESARTAVRVDNYRTEFESQRDLMETELDEKKQNLVAEEQRLSLLLKPLSLAG